MYYASSNIIVVEISILWNL